MDPFTVSTYNIDYLANIYRYQWKEHVKIRNPAEFEGDCEKLAEI